MTHITIYRSRGQECCAFRCMGHAGYADAGEDIERLVGDPFDLVADQESGLIDFSLREGYSQESLLLIRSLALGLQGIQDNYGTDYMTLKFEEV